MKKINWEKIEKGLNRMNGFSVAYWQKGKGSWKLIPRIYINGKELNHKKWTFITLVWDNFGEAMLEGVSVFKNKTLTKKQIKDIIKKSK